MSSLLGVLCLACIMAAGLSTAANCQRDRQDAMEDCGPGGRPGCFVPRCVGEDYEAVQCQGSGCFCVDKGGHKLKNYWWNHGTPPSECECARAEAGGANLGARCARNGGFL